MDEHDLPKSSSTMIELVASALTRLKASGAEDPIRQHGEGNEEQSVLTVPCNDGFKWHCEVGEARLFNKRALARRHRSTVWVFSNVFGP